MLSNRGVLKALLGSQNKNRSGYLSHGGLECSRIAIMSGTSERWWDPGFPVKKGQAGMRVEDPKLLLLSASPRRLVLYLVPSDMAWDTGMSQGVSSKYSSWSRVVKIHFQTRPGFARGLSDRLPKFIKAEGSLGLYKELVPLWGHQIPYDAEIPDLVADVNNQCTDIVVSNAQETILPEVLSGRVYFIKSKVNLETMLRTFGSYLHFCLSFPTPSSKAIVCYTSPASSEALDIIKKSLIDPPGILSDAQISSPPGPSYIIDNSPLPNLDDLMAQDIAMESVAAHTKVVPTPGHPCNLASEPHWAGSKDLEAGWRPGCLWESELDGPSHAARPPDLGKGEPIVLSYHFGRKSREIEFDERRAPFNELRASVGRVGQLAQLAHLALARARWPL
ncbi:hypothetical protein KSP39_PZI012421 [Platanthera zijinensis]|uniref:Uncharacterized protein n=1 Tax=Platanthera zijinensis TaxID=2320716 RepID=A0AAP0G4Y3_9ASPA